MFQKILVAMDNSEMGTHVFEKALSVGESLNASLMLLHVLSPEAEDSPGFPGSPMLDYYPWTLEDVNVHYRQQWDEFESECLELLRSRTEKAHGAGVNARFAQIPGSPGEAICTFALNWDADLIVIGHRGLSGLSELILGSISNYVVHHALCSVLTVRFPVEKLDKIPQPR
ncbi:MULTISPECIES: universal stress protein [unclassified Coleofasciculus]|uniref:universal stress protein n=1 Tax=unclassified Coleofasciculus TaxID=2692782 RepID=UPI0018803262|nr:MULTISPECIES: universal stress protein [unclassified Coleofasciculus]MBE9129286.1 universal stress protein [Coleofasciculus sp. LEGE 07081]MBE9151930.1 universal stress protein [Coleofasciculus sp. LEGE 07092]